MKKVIIIGAGSFGIAVADLVRAAGDEVVGFLDDFKSGEHCGEYPVLGKIEKCLEISDCLFINAISNVDVRKRIDRTYNLSWYTAIHPSAIIAYDAEIGAGSIIMPRVVVNTGAKIGVHSILNTGAIVEYKCIVSDYVHLCPGAVIAGEAHLHSLNQIGVSACVKNGVSICRGCLIGAGAAVVSNITEPGMYIGVPARKINH